MREDELVLDKMTDEKPTLCRTPTSMAFKIQDLEIKIIELEEKLKNLEKKESDGKKTKKHVK